MSKRKPKKTQAEIWQEVRQDPEKLKYFKHNWAINAIRRASYRWPGYFNAKKKNFIIVPYTLKNGTVKDIERCFCSVCGIISKKKDFQLDHIIPCVPLDGWDSFNGFIDRTMCLEDQLIVKCKPCHKEVTNKQIEQRVEHRKKNRIDNT